MNSSIVLMLPVIAILLVVTNSVVTAECPLGCVCVGSPTVRCSGLTTPPLASDLSINITSLYLRGLF